MKNQATWVIGYMIYTVSFMRDGSYVMTAKHRAKCMNYGKPDGYWIPNPPEGE